MNKTIRVTQLSTTDAIGGAAMAAKRLHHAFLEQGVASTMYVARAITQDNGVVEFKAAGDRAPQSLNRFIYRASRRLQHQPKTPDASLFTLDRTPLGNAPLRRMPAADIYHLHWISGFIDFRSLPLLARRSPIVWTFHDMNAFTGGCHYDRNCGRFTDHCGACPVLRSDNTQDVSFRTIQRKSQILRTIPKSRLVAVSPSEWLASETRRSHLFGDFITRVIPNGIDLSVFMPVDRAAIRTRLGFQPEDRVVLFVAENMNDARKGCRQTLEALAPITGLPRLRIMTMGKPGFTAEMSGPQYLHMGSVHDPLKIRDIYNAADLFIITSVQDNFPNTVIEALACGTPVAGFATGGVVDAVQQGVGLLTPTGDIAGLTNCLRTILEDDERRNAMRSAARKRAEANYGVERQAQAYRALYEEMLSGDITSDRKTATPLAPRQ